MLWRSSGSWLILSYSTASSWAKPITCGPQVLRISPFLAQSPSSRSKKIQLSSPEARHRFLGSLLLLSHFAYIQVLSLLLPPPQWMVERMILWTCTVSVRRSVGSQHAHSIHVITLSETRPYVGYVSCLHCLCITSVTYVGYVSCLHCLCITSVTYASM